MRTACVSLVALLALATPASADEINVAVAANFTEAAKEIAQAFGEKTGHKVVLSFGATGQLYTQITQAAPFAVFLAADDTTPKKAVDDGFGVAGTNFTYAVGKLVLWSKNPATPAGAETLKAGGFQKLAIANPKTAPYGAAAVEALKALKLYEAVEPKIVQGTNIAQTQQFIDTGNAELGFVALSQVIKVAEGTQWLVPADLYQPIRQDAVLVKSAEGNAAARAFIDFLKGPEALAVIAKYGYASGSGA